MDERGQRGRVPYGAIVAGLTSLAAVLLMMKGSQASTEAIERGLALCVTTMIPTLFPFMVISELMVRSGAGRGIARLLSWLLRPLLGLSEGGVCAFVMGVLCGFPVGAKTAADYYRRGEMEAREFNHVVCFSGLPSSAYLIGAVGGGLFHHASLGRALWGVTLLASVLIGLLYRFALPRRVYATTHVTPHDRMPPPRSATVIPTSISSAALAMLNVCATVVVFSALVGVLTDLLAALSLDETARAALFGLFELSTGMNEGASLGNAQHAAVLCAAVAGWGGLSVHCQIMAVCDGCPLSLGWFWAARVLGALISGVGMWLCLQTGLISLSSGPMPPLLAVGAAGQESLERVWRVFCTTALMVALWWCAIQHQKERREA